MGLEEGIGLNSLLPLSQGEGEKQDWLLFYRVLYLRRFLNDLRL